MAWVQLAAGRDVLVPRFLGRLDFVELVLLSSPQDAADRFIRRSRDAVTAVHRDAQALLERSGGVGELSAMYDRLLEVVARRPRTRTLMTVDGEPEQAYRDLLAQIGSA
jgi:hypothetical protein